MADREKAVIALRKELEMVSHILNFSINKRTRIRKFLGKKSRIFSFRSKQSFIATSKLRAE